MDKLKSFTIYLTAAKRLLSLAAVFLLIDVAPAYAASTEGAAADSHSAHNFEILLMLTILLLFAKIGGVVEKFNIPGVLGELLAGIVLSVYGYLGLGLIDDMLHNEIVTFFAQFGAVLLLFQVGLESNIKEMVSVGTKSLKVALVGVAAPFLVGAYVIGPVFFPEASTAAHLFIGASIVATSVGITASVFKGLGISKTETAQTVIGAAVIDDILGLLLLAIVSSFAAGEEITVMSVATLTFTSFAFLGAAILIGNLFAERISRFFSMLHTGTGMKLGIVLIFALGYAYAASLFGLEPIVGAFAAGLVLDAVQFRFFDIPHIAQDLAKLKGHNKEEKEHIAHLRSHLEHTHIEEMIEGIGFVFIPLFFVYTGMQIDIASLLNPSLYWIAGIISLIAIASKLIAGFVINDTLNNKLLIGLAMVPRGEVGLIFLSIGQSLGAIDTDLFSVLLLVIVVTTFIAPILLKSVVQRAQAEAGDKVATSPDAQLAH